MSVRPLPHPPSPSHLSTPFQTQKKMPNHFNPYPCFLHWPDGAAEQKNRMEEKQRTSRKDRKKNKEEWMPLYVLCIWKLVCFVLLCFLSFFLSFNAYSKRHISVASFVVVFFLLTFFVCIMLVCSTTRQGMGVSVFYPAPTLILLLFSFLEK